MRKFLAAIILLSMLGTQVSALELAAPEVPEFVADLMPKDPQNLMEGVIQVIKEAISHLRPDLQEASNLCFQILVSVLLCSVLRSLPGSSETVTDMAVIITVSWMLLKSSNSMIREGERVITEMTEYGKLLLPVMGTALAAQGGVTTAGALYAGTVFFISFLGGIIGKLLIPMLYLYLAIAIGSAATGEAVLSGLLGSMKGIITWLLKTVLYVFTGFMGVTGVVSGTTDAAALKAAKLTISSMVPVVGGILSDASEAVLVTAAAVKNAAGIYGMLAILAIWIAPFLKIGTHYLLLKASAGLCGILASKRVTGVVEQFCAVMGFLLAMTGAVCILLMVSTVCFLKGSA